MMIPLRWLAATCAISFGFTLQAADSPLSQVSKEADVVIRIRAFDTTVEKIAALANAVQPGAGDIVSQNATLFGPVLSNPSMTGVDRTKDFYLVLFVREEREPKALFAIPTTDGAELQKALPENFESQVRANWVFYADKDHGIPEAVAAPDSLATVMTSSKANGVFEKSDIGLHINVSHITSVYDPKIQEGRQKFEEGIQKGMNTPGVDNAEAIVAILKAETDLAFQFLDETETVTIGLTATPEGLEVEDYIGFEAGSQIATFLKRQPKSDFAALTKLSTDLPCYMGMSLDFAEFAKIAQPFSDALYQDDAIKQAMKEFAAQFSALKVTSAVMAFDLASGTNGVLRTSAIMETNGASDLLAANRKFAAASKTIKIGQVTQETSLEADAETVGTHKIDLVTIKQTMDPNQPGAQMQTMLKGIMFGPNGIQSRITAMADGLLQVQGGSAETMADAIKAYEAKSNSLSDVRAGLDAESHLLVLFDLPGLVNNGLLAATTIPGVPIPFQRAAVEDLQIGHSYIATSVVGEEQGVRIKTMVPVEQFQGVLKLVGFVQSIRGR